MEHPLGYREVIPDQTLPDKWKEFSLSIGGTQSTLQDIKVPERSGGFSYRDDTKCFTRNRFIYWRTHNDVLELVEHSLDLNLKSNCVRYQFKDTPILEGVSIHETRNSVVILIATVSSVHRLTFSHPDKIHRQDHIYGYIDSSAPSIFAEATLAAVKDPSTYYVINTSTLLPHTSASYLAVRDEAVFALAYSTGLILLVRMDPSTGSVSTQELKHESLLPRLFRLSFSKSNDGIIPVSMVLHAIGLETYLFCLCRDASLRMWSCSKAQCVSVLDLLDKQSSVVSTRGLQKAENLLLRKGVCDGEVVLGAFICDAWGSEFNILRVVNDGGSLFKLVSIATRPASKDDLVDFCLSSNRIWAVWMTALSEPLVSSAKFEGHTWEPVILEQPLDQEESISSDDTDPRHPYISYIFRPCRFPLQIITRALSLYERIAHDTSLSSDIIKERVCIAVENEIQSKVEHSDITDEDYLRIAHDCWSRFYSCCVQYHEAATKPVGLTLINKSGVLLIKKQQFSIIRPMDASEHLLQFGCEDCTFEQLRHSRSFNVDEQMCGDALVVMSVLSYLENTLPSTVKSTFSKGLSELRSPYEIAKEVVDTLEQTPELMNERFLLNIREKLESTRDVIGGIMTINSALMLDSEETHDLEARLLEVGTSKFLLQINQLFYSALGTSMVTESLFQMASNRFAVCCNLLILQCLLIKHCRNIYSAFNPRAMSGFDNHSRNQTINLTRAYYVLLWACKSDAYIGNIDSKLHELAGLKLSETGVSRYFQQRPRTVMELFVHYCAAEHARRWLVHCKLKERDLPMWHRSLLEYIGFVGHLVSSNLVFPEFLLSSGQYLAIQEYTRLFSWCETNKNVRSYLLAISLLANGEPHKALDLFLRASKDISDDDYFSEKIFNVNPDEISEKKLLLKYYNQVINMFEQLQYSDCVIATAVSAISSAASGSEDLARLYTKIFNHHLHLGHHKEAYNFLILNPVEEDRKVCLHKLVVTLFERRRLDTLADFPYVGMCLDLERIVESHARSQDVLTGHYYNFLYTFHVKQNNLRKAATIMFEQGFRLGRESAGGEASLKKQARCYATCLCALRLVNKKYQWIVKPVLVEPDNEPSLMGRSPNKRSVNGESIHREPEKRIEVLEIKDIMREHALVSARLMVVTHSPTHATTGSFLSPGELVTVLTSLGLYKTALKICQLFKICNYSVFEGLATMCVKLNSVRDPSTAWDWLAKNDIDDLRVGRKGSVTDVAWKLLETLLMEHEEPKLSTLHKVVTKQICALGVFLPQWLISSYKLRNPAEYLRILLSSGRIYDAAELSVDYIKASLGHGTEYFGNLVQLHSTGPPTWLPIQTIELVLLELRDRHRDTEYEEVYQTLMKTYNYFLDTLVHVEKNRT